ncbi:MAG: hypothetical protein ACKVU1_12830 [bacterium]
MFAHLCGPVARAAIVLAAVLISALSFAIPRAAFAQDAAEPDSQAAAPESGAATEPRADADTDAAADAGADSSGATQAAQKPADEAPSDAATMSETGEADAAPGADASEERLEPGTALDAQPLQLFERIARAWSDGAADSLLAHFGEGKVSLAFSHGGPRGGLFTRTQAGYLLADLFKYSTTEKFEYVKFRNIEKDGQLPYAVADRVFRLENGILYHDQVYVSLRREASAWKIAEIKSIDR